MLCAPSSYVSIICVLTATIHAVGKEHTCCNWLCISHIHGELQTTSSTKTSAGYQARRTGHNVTLASQLAAPPMGTKELNKFSGTIYAHEICAGTTLQHFIEDTYDLRCQ